MSTNREPPRAGDVIGRRVGGYLIDSLIGEGGMGAVYSCTNARLGRRAALKVIAGEFTRRGDLVDRFFREAKAVAAVDDPNIIDIYDAAQFPQDDLTYILMPYIAGRSLDAVCEEHRPAPMPLDVAAVIALQIASGLDAVHAVGIVHRDIKPANILVSRRQRRRYFVTIVDFGIAKLLDPHLAEGFRTRTRSVIGTAGYMAPEQARGDRDVDGRADVYSLATVLYRMLAGRRPYTEESLYGLIEKQIQNAPFPRPRALRPDIPPMWEDAILDSLQVDRARRPASMKEFAQRLAAGVPNGDELLRAFAPRLGPDAVLAPTEETLTGDLESSISRWSHARTTPGPHVRLTFGALAASMVAGVLIGAGATHVTSRSGGDPRVDPAPAATRTPGDATVERRELLARVRAETAGFSLDAGGPPRPVDAGDAGDAGNAGATAIPAAVAQTGTLVVKVKPYAEVTIDGEAAGTTPVRRTVRVGVHRVKLVGATQSEVVTVQVGPSRDATIARNW